MNNKNYFELPKSQITFYWNLLKIMYLSYKTKLKEKKGQQYITKSNSIQLILINKLLVCLVELINLTMSRMISYSKWLDDK